MPKMMIHSLPEFQTKSYQKMLSRINKKKSRKQPIMLKRFEWLKEYLRKNSLIIN